MNTSCLSPYQLIAHRGQTRDFPENTLPALQAAVDAGATAVEIDLQCTQDGVLVLFHDTKLKRVCGSGGRIHKLSREQTKALSAYEPKRLGNRFLGTPIADLSDLCTFLAQHPQVECFVEMKPQSIERWGVTHCAHQLVEQLRTVLSQCTFISFDEDFVNYMIDNSGNRAGLIIRRRRQLRNLNPHMAVCFANIKRLRRGDDLTRLPVPVAVYEVNDIDEVLAWLARGARWVESHDVAGLLAKVSS